MPIPRSFRLLVPLFVFLFLFAMMTAIAASPPAGPADEQLLVNGDFEAGFVTTTVGLDEGLIGAGWTPFVVTGTVRFQAGQVEPPLDRFQVLQGGGGVALAGIFQQAQNLQPGDVLHAEAQVFLPAGIDGISKTIGIDPFGGVDPRAPGIVWSQIVTTTASGPWQTIAVTATAAATRTTLFVRVEHGTTSLAGPVYIDDISLQLAGRVRRVYLPAVPVSNAPEPGGWQYQVSDIITGTPSCDSTGFSGVIRDENGRPVAGVQVAVWEAPSGMTISLSPPSGPDGRWQVVIDASAARAGRWQLAVVDDNGNYISPVVGRVAYLDSLASIEAPGIPTSDDCVNGHQQLHVNFKARREFPDYTLASVRFLSCQDNHLDHNLRLWVIDQAGNGLRGVPVAFQEAGGFTDQLSTGRDPFKPAGYIDYPIFRRQLWTTEVLSGTSDLSFPASSETAPYIDACSGNAWGHYSYEIVFQRRPGQP